MGDPAGLLTVRAIGRRHPRVRPGDDGEMRLDLCVGLDPGLRRERVHGVYASGCGVEHVLVCLRSGGRAWAL